MTSLDLPEDDLEFLSGLMRHTTGPDDNEQAFKEAQSHIEDSMSTMDTYQSLYETIGYNVLLALAASGALTDIPGIELYAALRRQDYLSNGIMALAIAYGGVCFHEGYKLAKEEADES